MRRLSLSSLLIPAAFLVLINASGVRPRSALALSDGVKEPAENSEVRQKIGREKEAVDSEKKKLLRLREEEKASVAAVRKVSREKKDAAREELKRKLSAVKDERSRLKVGNIAQKMEDINDRRTAHFLKILDRLTEISAKIEARANDMRSKGLDVSKIDAALEAAKAAINRAREAVTGQEAKIYKLNIGDEGTLRADVGKAMSSLEADLKTVMRLVQEAHTAVFNAWRALNGLEMGVKESSPSSR